MLSFVHDSGELPAVSQERSAALSINAVETESPVVIADHACVAGVSVRLVVALPMPREMAGVIGAHKTAMRLPAGKRGKHPDIESCGLESLGSEGLGVGRADRITARIAVTMTGESKGNEPHVGRSQARRRAQRSRCSRQRLRQTFYELVAGKTIFVHRRFTREGHTAESWWRNGRLRVASQDLVRRKVLATSGVLRMWRGRDNKVTNERFGPILPNY